jgi:thiamine transport system substrate-binding protein
VAVTRRAVAPALSALVALALAACEPEGRPGALGTPPATGAARETTAEVVTDGAQAGTPGPGPFAGRTLEVMTHDSFAVSDAVLDAFQRETGARVQVLESGDAGSMLNKAILAKGAPLADVLYGVDNSFLSRALAEDIFEPYAPAALFWLPAELWQDPAQGAVPIDYADVCLNVDTAWFAEHGLAPPGDLDDLTDPAYRELLVVQNPAMSSPGMAFLLTTVAHAGEAGYLDYWRRLMANGTEIVNDWETAYNVSFSGGPGQGTRPIVVSYSSSPAFEVLYGEDVTEPGTAAVTADGSCFRQVEYAGILAGTAERELAERWIDFMLSPAFQADMPAQMFVFPVLPGVELGEVFDRFLVEPEVPAALPPEAIAAGRERWLRAWTEAILR